MQFTHAIKRVLISVYEKNQITEFAKFLYKQNIKIISTQGTATFLRNQGLKITEVSEYTNFPEIMHGRVKTLHHAIYSGILANRSSDEIIMEKFNIKFIDMVVINLYPFSKKIKDPQCTLKEAIENIDIGGTGIIRAAAKNYKNVTVLTDNLDYKLIISEMYQNNNKITDSTKFKLATKAFQYIAKHDDDIANYFNSKILRKIKNTKQAKNNFPEKLKLINVKFIKKDNLRYGENYQQNAAIYNYANNDANHSIVQGVKKLQGKQISYNNMIDINTALECINSFVEPTCIIIKHANPCGAATATEINIAYEKAYNSDSTSAFGGVIIFNKKLDEFTSNNIINKQFVEVIIAPSFTKGALNILSKKQNIRIISYDKTSTVMPFIDIQMINNGLLLQDYNMQTINIDKITIVTQRKPTHEEMKNALFCWKIIKFVKSNAIVFAKNQQTYGIGAGQMSRMFAVKIAIIKAKDEKLSIRGATMASDAFFTFSDGIKMAIDEGITCIIQPGGSIKDKEIIHIANKHNIAMIFTHIRHFRH